jgi:parallel beta-helix repeat protein/predicted outer membrane repeat protein
VTGDCIEWGPMPPVGEWCCEGEDWSSECAALAREYCEVCSGVSTSTGPDCDNSCHVVTGSGADATAILDGFVITAGNADAFDANAGGGLYNDGGNPTITDCVFTGNSAQYGGGMGNYGASPTVTNCTFTENTAEIGGGMDSEGGNPTITDCMFTGNSADYNGGGMSNDDASPTLTNCTFTQNSAESSSGGGMVNAGSGASPTLTNCTFTQNAADETGGAVFNVSYSNPTLVDCLISENSAGVRGGGMENRQYGAPTLINCRLINNLSDGIYFANSASGTLTDCAFIGNSGRGAICYAGSSPTLLNCIFTGNSGGGMSCLGYEGTNPTLINCTFSGNSGSPGGAIYCGGYSGPALTNCVLWNGIDGVWCEADATPTITYSDVQGGWEGTGNIDADPLFVPGPLGPYYLSQTAAGDPFQSPCSDAGDAASPLVDGTTRCDEVLDTGIVDMGYHYPVSGLPLIMGDFDYDGDVDLGDFAGFEDCLGGSDQVIVSPPCRVFDFDADGDVDLGDFASFQVAFAGA